MGSRPHAGMIRAGQGYSIGLAPGNAASLAIVNPTALEAIRVRRSPARLETALRRHFVAVLLITIDQSTATAAGLAG